MKNAMYLGDGVYVSESVRYDGNVYLTTGHHNPQSADNTVVMEPQVLEQFLKWIERRRKKHEQT